MLDCRLARQSADDLDLELPNGRCLTARLLGRDGPRVVLAVPIPACPPIEVGDRVQFGSMKRRSKGAFFSGVVASVDSHRAMLHVGIEPCESGGESISRADGGGSTTTGNRPSVRAASSATLRIDGSTLQGRIRDVSLTTISIYVREDRGNSIAPGTSAEIAFALSVSSGELRFAATLQRREPLCHGVIYDVRLIDDASSDIQRLKESLAQFAGSPR